MLDELKTNEVNWQEALTPCCFICTHYKDSYCINVETENVVEGGLFQVIKKPTEWHCPLFDLKAAG